MSDPGSHLVEKDPLVRVSDDSDDTYVAPIPLGQRLRHALLGEKARSFDDEIGSSEDSRALLGGANGSPLPEKTQPRRTRRCAIPTTTQMLDFLKAFLFFLIPSFIAARLGGKKQAPSKLRPTAYLDGLRGLAAWAVVNSHTGLLLDYEAKNGFGHGPHDYQWYKLPIIRQIFNGGAAVALFFIISGYALSISPVVAMRKTPRDPGTFMRKIASSTLRRPIRLFLPVWAALLIVFLLVRFGPVDYIIKHEQEYLVHFGGLARPSSEIHHKVGTFGEQLKDVIWQGVNQFSCFTDWKKRAWTTSYDPATWTIPLEFRSSLVLYLTHAALFLMQPKMRVSIISLLLALAAILQGFDFLLFWAGYFVAELSPLLSGKPVVEKKMTTAIWSVVLLAGLYIASFPAFEAYKTPGYEWMSQVTPWPWDIKSRWWNTVGAILIMLSLDRVWWARSILNSPIVQYMGKISFSFYLMHLWILYCIGMPTFHYAFSLTGRDNFFSNALGFCMGYGVLWTCIIVVGDLFWRAVDVHCTSLGFKVEKWLFVN